jgi:hypothetical protein
MMHEDNKKPKKLKHAKNIRGQGMRTLNEHDAESFNDRQYLMDYEDEDTERERLDLPAVGETDPQILSEYLKKP